MYLLFFFSYLFWRAEGNLGKKHHTMVRPKSEVLLGNRLRSEKSWSHKLWRVVQWDKSSSS